MNNKVLLSFTAFLIAFSLLYSEVMYSSSQHITTQFPLIIIDAGHGGEDGGAVAKDGTAEKDINLQISLKLNDILSALGFNTKLIRTTDTAIHTEGDTIRARKISDIHNRKAIMDECDNCLYISIHQNKYSDSSIWGAQTFYSKNDEKSKDLAQFIQSTISGQLQPENKRKIKPSGTDIYLLYNATKPAVMVECGFLSNPDELSKLTDSEYQNKMALSIAIGILNYNISEVKNGSEV